MASFLLLNGSTAVLALVVARRLGFGWSCRLPLARDAGGLSRAHAFADAWRRTAWHAHRRRLAAVLLILVTGVATLAGWVGVLDHDAGPRARTTAAPRRASLIAALLGAVWTWPHLFAATQVWGLGASR